jgi:hypothetical protein
VAIVVEAFMFMTTWMVTTYRYVEPLIFGSKVFWFSASNIGRIATVPLVCTSSAEVMSIPPFVARSEVVHSCIEFAH